MTRRQFSVALLALLFCAGATYAVDWTIDEMRYRALLADRALVAGERDVSIKPERACPAPDETLVFLIFGQSNAANHGAVRTHAPDGVYDFFQGRCFSGDDPQFSATGAGGSPWPSFAEALRERGETRPILMANLAVGNTRANQWTADAEHAAKLIDARRRLHAQGYQVAAAFFFQGEADRETPEEDYRQSLASIAAGFGDTPVIVSNSSICGIDHAPVTALARARSTLAGLENNVTLGPDTDKLGREYRSDGCHFNEAGLRALGEMWADSVHPILEQ